MYNDYYLEQINDKLQDTNISLQEIITNQEILISGDKIIQNKIDEVTNTNILLAMLLAIFLIYQFTMRCLR